MSSEAYVDVQDAAAPTKKMRTIQNTVGGNTVQSETIVLSTDGADKYDAREVPDLTASGTLSCTNQTLQLSIVGRSGASAVLVYNSGTSSVLFDVSNDGTSWISAGVWDGSLMRISATASGTFQFLDLAGMQYVRVRANVVFSANVTVSLRATYGGNFSDPRTIQKSGSTIGPNYGGNIGGWTGSTFALVQALATNPVGTESGLIVRNIPSGTQTVAQNLLGATDNPDVTVNHSGTLPTDVTDRLARLLGQVQGDTPSGSADANNPVKIGGVANTGLPSAVSSSQRANLLTDVYGRPRATDERPKLLGLYYVESGNLTVQASAHAATAGFFWLINPVGSTVTVYLRSVGFVW